VLPRRTVRRRHRPVARAAVTRCAARIAHRRSGWVSRPNDAGFQLEGVQLLPVEIVGTGTGVITGILHIRDIGLIAAVHVVYSGVHPYLIEWGATAGLDARLTALVIAEAVRPATVIAGHKDPRPFDTASEIRSTRRHLTEACRLQADCTSVGAFYKGMLVLHPHPGGLWDAAMTLFPPTHGPHSRPNLTRSDSSLSRH
jgi:hypothetical protein